MPDPDDEPKSFLDKYEKPLKYGTAGIFIVIAIVFGSIYLSLAPTAPEPYWSRFIGLLPIIEALLYASAGFIFGKEVHREQAEKAEKRANKESSRAESAIKNRALLKKSVTDFQRHFTPQKMDVLFKSFTTLKAGKQVLPQVRTKMETELENLVADANKYFPD